MPFSCATTWKERGLQAQAIKDECNAIIRRLALPETDVRHQAMIHVRQFCNTLAAVPIKLQQNAENSANIPFMLALLGLSSTDHLRSVLVDLNKNSKLSFLTMVQFALEHCIEEILGAIPNEGRGGQFRASADRLVHITAVKPAAHKLELLLVPAWIRNTFHSNGIHRKGSKSVNVDGEQYVFTQGERLSCGSWSHIFHVVLTALPIYEEMFLAKPGNTGRSPS